MTRCLNRARVATVVEVIERLADDARAHLKTMSGTRERAYLRGVFTGYRASALFLREYITDRPENEVCTPCSCQPSNAPVVSNEAAPTTGR